MVLRTATFAMATRFELVLARDDARAKAAAEAAVAAIEECDARYSRFRRNSLVSRINREAPAAWVKVDPETYTLLERCLAWREATEGAFDVCVGKPMDLVRGGRAEPASPEELRAGAYELDAESSSVRFTRANTALDFGAVGKGHALDLAGDVLRDSGIDCALLHGGTSSVLGIGAPPSSPEGWRVELGPELEHSTVVLRDRALSISAARGGRGEAARPHVLDPRSGVLVPGAARAAVRARSAREAEVWSTALLVLAARRAIGGSAPHPIELPDGLEVFALDDSAHPPRQPRNSARRSRSSSAAGPP